jgi:hypothetical protein
VFDQILDLVGQPPGSLVYHFILLFAVQAALAMSVGQWMRERSPNTTRLMLGILGITIARGLVLIASLLVWQGILPTNVVLPPIERAVDTVTILILAWMFITMDDPAILRRNLIPDVAAAILSLIILLPLMAGTYYYWLSGAASGQLFNGQILDFAWGIGQALVALVGLIWMLTRIRYIYDPFLKGAMLIFLGAAAVLHMLRPGLGDVAAAMRLGQIIVMPMLAAVAYRHVVEQLLHWDTFEPSRLQEIPQPVAVIEPPSPPRPIAPPPPETLQETMRAPQPLASKQKITQPQLLEVVDAMSGLLSTLDQPEIIKQAPRAVATALRADIAVLAIVDEEAQQAGVVGG